MVDFILEYVDGRENVHVQNNLLARTLLTQSFRTLNSLPYLSFPMKKNISLHVNASKIAVGVTNCSTLICVLRRLIYVSEYYHWSQSAH